MDPKFYEKDLYASKNDDLEFVRSPFYDLAKQEHISKDKADQLIDELQVKLN
jgi:hypothetical protein